MYFGFFIPILHTVCPQMATSIHPSIHTSFHPSFHPLFIVTWWVWIRGQETADTLDKLADIVMFFFILDDGRVWLKHWLVDIISQNFLIISESAYMLSMMCQYENLSFGDDNAEKDDWDHLWVKSEVSCLSERAADRLIFCALSMISEHHAGDKDHSGAISQEFLCAYQLEF